MKTLKNFYDENNQKLTLYFSVVFLLIALYFLSYPIASIRFFVLIPLAVLLGMGLVSFFKDVLPIKNLLTYLSLSFLLGLFLNTMVIFIWGSLGFSFGGVFFITYLAIVIVLNFILYAKYLPEEELSNYWRGLKLDLIDIVWIAILLVFSYVFLSIALESYFLGWDGFTFWALDAKYIFENSSLRDESFDVLFGSYYSFYPLQLSFIYLLYGKLVEQHASLLALLYGLVGASVLYGYIIDIKKNQLIKSLLYFIVIAVLYTWFSIHNVIFTLYADVFCSVMILLYGVILFKDIRRIQLGSYWKRVLLLSLIAASFYLTKFGYSVITVFLLGAIFLYDIRFWYVQILKKKWWILAILSALLLMGLVVFYIKDSADESGIIGYAFHKFTSNNSYRIRYTFEMMKFLVSELAIFLISSVVFFFVSFFLNGKITKSNLKNLAFVLFIAMIPLVFYVISLQTLADYSLLRYLGIIYFITPLLLIKLAPTFESRSEFQREVATLVTVLIASFIAISLIFQWNVDLKFTPNSGSYKDDPRLWKYSVAAENVENIVEEDSRILILDEELGRLGNSRAPSMYQRYFLSQYSVGRQYITNVETWYPFMLEVDPDYVLVLEYDGYWESCNDILEEGAIQLIEIREGHKDYSETECFFEAEDVTVVFP